ncbi:MAG: hypothetical protein FWE14_07300 [Lachnospiraceae bacterium]|nr:hypothetical protein [Lachnospiraceae bacterium]
MKEQTIKNHIAAIHQELDSYLAAGDRESIMKSIALLNQTWGNFFNKDDGIRYTYLFQKIWMDEVARGEHQVFAGIHSVEEVLRKIKLIRHAFFRLENDFPLEMCLEGLQNISEMKLSQTAFQALLEREIENGAKVTARINEMATMNS